MCAKRMATRRVRTSVRPDGRPVWPWRRQPGESHQAFQAFEVYRDTPIRGGRSIRGTAHTLGKSRQLLERWSVKWGWVERCDGYDFAVHRLRWARHMKEVAERARQEAQEEEAAKFAPFYDDLRAAALLMPVGDLIELIGGERLGGRGTDTAPRHENALEPWLGGRTPGAGRGPRETSRSDERRATPMDVPVNRGEFEASETEVEQRGV